MPMNKGQYIEHYKKGHTINAMADVIAAAQAEMIEELLIAAEGSLSHALDNALGDVELLFPGERKLLDVYASWDYYNRGRGRKTRPELVAAAIEANREDEDDEPEPDTD